ncbi:unnamed protein product, partial [Ixodes pacificus]
LRWWLRWWLRRRPRLRRRSRSRSRSRWSCCRPRCRLRRRSRPRWLWRLWRLRRLRLQGLEYQAPETITHRTCTKTTPCLEIDRSWVASAREDLVHLYKRIILVSFVNKVPNLLQNKPTVPFNTCAQIKRHGGKYCVMPIPTSFV